jgi:hypothetical protein
VPTLLPISDVGLSGAWHTHDTPATFYSQLAKTTPNVGTFVFSPNCIFYGAGYLREQMAPTSQPAVTTGHQVYLNCYAANPGYLQVNLRVIDGNTNAVLSTGTAGNGGIIYPTQTPTDFYWTIPASDVAGFAASSYGALVVEMAPQATAGEQYFYADLLNFIVPSTDLNGGAEMDLVLGMSAVGSIEIPGAATMSLSLGMTASGQVDGAIYGSATVNLSLGMAATGGVEVPGAPLVFGLSLGMTAGRLMPEPQSRRDVVLPSPLGKPASRRDR